MKKMPKKLEILIIISALVFFIYVLKNIKNKKLTVQNAIIWMVLAIGIVILALGSNFFEKMAQILGIQNLSNLSFFVGFLFLIFVCFNITKTLSVQNKKIISLTQELALLKSEGEKHETKQKRNAKNN